MARPILAGDYITDIYTWLCEPDTVEEASLDWLKDWINRRPIAEVGMLAMIGSVDLPETPPVSSPYAVRDAALAVVKANKDFRERMPNDWDGDPLQDACAALEAALTQSSEPQS